MKGAWKNAQKDALAYIYIYMLGQVEGFHRTKQTLVVATNLADAYHMVQSMMLIDLLLQYGVSLTQ